MKLNETSRRVMVKSVFVLVGLSGLMGMGMRFFKRGGRMADGNQAENPVKRVFPIDFHWPTADPFLFCAYHKDNYPKGTEKMGPAEGLGQRDWGMDFQVQNGFRMYHGKEVPGFPVHPHRGFETVTIVQEGMVDHADSLGAAGRYGNGDIQWMTAGKGIQHSEMFPLLDREEKNPLELFQVWVNLPKKSKFVEPHFKMYWEDGVTTQLNKDFTARVIAGSFGEFKAAAPPPDSWAAEEDAELAIIQIKLSTSGSKVKIPAASAGVNRTLYFYSGESVQVNGEDYKAMQGLTLEPSVELEIVNPTKVYAEFLLLQGRPIGEPVAQHGPFVMNTKDEINQAIADYRQTSFGGWPWDRSDMVHGDKQRFAKYPDGKIEKPT